MIATALALLAHLLSAAPAPGRLVEARMVLAYDLSPDGRTLYFAYHGDIWRVPAAGGAARRLTFGPAEDGSPLVSPDGRKLVFVSDRDPDGRAIWWLPAEGGAPRRLRPPTGRRYRPVDFTPDGRALLVVGGSDRDPFRGARLFLIPFERPDAAPREVLPVSARSARYAPDGRRLALVRGGRPSLRKGYVGPAAARLWLAEPGDPPHFTRLSPDRPDAMLEAWSEPLWRDGTHLLTVIEEDGVRDLFELDLTTGRRRALTHFGPAGDRGRAGADDGVLRPVLARNAPLVVFRRGFDLFRLALEGAAEPERIRILVPEEPELERERRSETKARAAAFTPGGLEVAFVAGGDLWVMDTVLKEPILVAGGPDEERFPLFDAEGERLFFVSDREGRRPDLWVARRKDPKRPWFRQEAFELRRLTNDAAEESAPRLSPDGKRLAFLKDGTLVHCDLEGRDLVTVDRGFDRPDFDWSPDARWFVLARSDADFNREILVVPAGGGPRVLISRHPRNDRSPAWSPDGRRIAWIGTREEGEVDLFWVELDPEAAEKSARARRLAEALAKFRKKGKQKNRPASGRGSRRAGGTSRPASGPAGGGRAASRPRARTARGTEAGVPRPWRLEPQALADAWERVRRLELEGSRESAPLWTKDGKGLLFRSAGAGRKGLYRLSLPKKGGPKQVLEDPPSALVRLPDGRFAGLAKGVPALLDPKGWKVATQAFTVRLSISWPELREAAFWQAWRLIGAHFYDPALNGRDWPAVGTRYAKVARDCLWPDQFQTLVNQMLGELNGSHLGYFGAPRPGPRPARAPWRRTPYRLGLIFDRRQGPGLLVERVVRTGPADRHTSRISAGERILSIDGEPVGPETDVDLMLRLQRPRPIVLEVQGKDGAKRKVSIEPVAATAFRDVLYEDFVRRTRAFVERASNGRLGYVHIRGMNWSSFHRLAKEIFAAGAGKEALLIDVRYNGGGFTADHVLTMLCQPEHAYTLPRGGREPGYPQDRRVYPTWTRPIVLLCNERSFSNAEILSHAIKTLKRGPIVGERTAGGVISTGGTRLLDGGFLRLPFRGWFLRDDGRDMELNGCLPDRRVPFGPDAEAAARDPQIEEAVRAGLEEIARRKAARPALVPRSQRKR